MTGSAPLKGTPSLKGTAPREGTSPGDSDGTDDPVDIVIDADGDEEGRWRDLFQAALPQARVHQWPQRSPQARIGIVWKPRQAFVDAHPHLRDVFTLAAGVDALQDLSLPDSLRVYRLEDAGMGAQMVDYVVHALLRHFREFDVYERATRAGQWAARAPRDRHDFPVGILGLGVLGRQVGTAVRALGFPVLGWTRAPARAGGREITRFSGAGELDDFLAATRVLVCLLPLTPQTEGILNARTLSLLRAPGYLVNVARGPHLVEDDLLALIDSGHLAGATLDVFRSEPLPPGHPFWSRPAITLTPHIAAQTIPHETVAQVVAGIEAVLAGRPAAGRVDRRRGY